MSHSMYEEYEDNTPPILKGKKMPKSDYDNYDSGDGGMRKDVSAAYDKVGAKKPKRKKMRSKGKKSPTGSAAIGGMGGGAGG